MNEHHLEALSPSEISLKIIFPRNNSFFWQFISIITHKLLKDFMRQLILYIYHLVADLVIKVINYTLQITLHSDLCCTKHPKNYVREFFHLDPLEQFIQFFWPPSTECLALLTYSQFHNQNKRGRNQSLFVHRPLAIRIPFHKSQPLFCRLYNYKTFTSSIEIYHFTDPQNQNSLSTSYFPWVMLTSCIHCSVLNPFQ